MGRLIGRSGRTSISGSARATGVDDRRILGCVSRSTRGNGLLLVAALALAMWVVEIIDVFTGDLDAHGIRPRDPSGLEGVATAPFLHAGFGHLIGNTIPFLAMGGVIALAGAARVAAVTAITALVSGAGTWWTRTWARPASRRRASAAMGPMTRAWCGVTRPR